MKKYFIYIIFPLFAFTMHKYYISLTEIEFNKEQQSIQMIMNVFMDDIELALNNEFNIDAQILNNNEIENLDEYFYKYLQKHFKISVNNQDKKYNFIGKEYDGNIVYFYLEITDISRVKSIEINNSVLVNEFSNQQNLIKVTIKGERKSLFLSKKNDKGLLNF